MTDRDHALRALLTQDPIPSPQRFAAEEAIPATRAQCSIAGLVWREVGGAGGSGADLFLTARRARLQHANAAGLEVLPRRWRRLAVQSPAALRRTQDSIGWCTIAAVVTSADDVARLRRIGDRHLRGVLEARTTMQDASFSSGDRRTLSLLIESACTGVECGERITRVLARIILAADFDALPPHVRRAATSTFRVRMESVIRRELEAPPPSTEACRAIIDAAGSDEP